MRRPASPSLFFCNDPAPTDIYTLSLHDALPISASANCVFSAWTSQEVTSGGSFEISSTTRATSAGCAYDGCCAAGFARSEEHTSELQSQFHLVCRLLLEKKKRSSAYNHPARQQA